MSAPTPIRLHARVEVARMGTGTVLFVGQTSFAAGLWVGVGLDPGVAGGKNDGSVQGKRYFEVDPGQGVFVRSSQVEVLPEEEQYSEGGFEEGSFDGEEEEEAMPEEDEEEQHYAVEETPKRGPVSLPRPSSSARTPATASRSGIVPPTRNLSPDKRDVPSSMSRPTSRPTSRPALVSRTSAASSTSATSSVASSLRRPPSSPSKPGNATPLRTPSSRGSTVPSSSGRVSAASSVGSSTSMRRPLGTATAGATATPRATGPTTPATRGIRPAQTAARPSVASSAQRPTGATRPATQPRPSATTNLAGRPSASGESDAKSTVARTALRSVAKARPSMAATSSTPRTAAGLGSSPAKPSATRPSELRSPEKRREEEDDNEGDATLTSPSAQARHRLEYSRARLEARRPSGQSEEGANGDQAGNFEDSDEDLISMQLTQSGAASKPAPTSSSNFETTALKRELEELRVKTRLGEKRREEDRARVKELEKWKEEAAEKIKYAESATAKAQSLSQQLLTLQTSERQATLEKTELEQRVEDLGEQLEMAALDREVAEEKADAAQTELDALKQTNEELSLEVEVLREENAAYEHAPVDEAERSSMGWVQLEKQNERLKEALIRLRDVTSETDHEQKRRISELEKDLSSLSDLQDSRDSLVAKLQASEAQLEDVKIQLDDALGAEEMLEQLTERNLFLGERIAEMAATVEELESLKELNEELEEMHIETEHQLQEEVDLKDMTLRERNARVEALEANAVEYEGTFDQFRELVLNLQGDLEALRAERDGLVEEGQNAQLSSQSREMLNLNLKLQSSALKSQGMTIDAELAKMKTEQALLQNDMTRPYLPEPFAREGDHDAVSSILFFKRMSFKAEILKTVVESNHDVSQKISSLTAAPNTDGDGADSTTIAAPDQIVGICQLRHSLAHFAAVCSSVAAMLRMAPPNTFLRCGRMYKEIQAAVEPRVDAFVEALKKEELRELDCGADFKRFVRQFEEMSYVLSVAQEEELQAMAAEGARGDNDALPSSDGDLAAKEVGSATLLDLDLDTLCASLINARQIVAGLSQGEAPVTWQSQGHFLDERYFEPLSKLVNDVRVTKTLARKLLRRLSTLASNDEAVSMDAIGPLPLLGRLSSRLVSFATALNTSVIAFSTEARSVQETASIEALVDLVKVASSELQLEDGSSAVPMTAGSASSSEIAEGVWQNALRASAHLATTINDLVAGATEQSNVIRISGQAPWQSRAVTVHAIASHNEDLEAQMIKLQSDLRDLYQQIKARDGALSEAAIKMERLQRQVEKSQGQDSAHEEVKVRLAEVRQQAKTYQEAHETLQTEMEALEKVNAELKAKVAANVADSASAASGGASATTTNADTAAKTSSILPRSGVVPAAHLETNYLVDQLDAMRVCLQYMREENSLLKSSGWRMELDALAPLASFGGNRSGQYADAVKVDDNGDRATQAQLLREAEEVIGMPRKAKKQVPKAEDLRTVEAERRQLYGSLLRFASSPRVIELAPPASNLKQQASTDVSNNTDERAVDAASHHQRSWRRRAQLPISQYEAQLATAEELGARYEKLRQRGKAVMATATTTTTTTPTTRFQRYPMPVVASVVKAA
ncbi:unnamed protein product [Jaminaea pallidilutea]